MTVILDIVYSAAGMFWQMLWALALGFGLSGLTQAFVSHERMAKALGRAGVKEISLGSLLGAMSSSCSFAAAAMARTLFQKGAHIITALAFMIASTNLVIELGLVLWRLLGWTFVAGELIGGVLLIALVAILMRLAGPLEEFARKRGERAEAAGCHHHHHQHAGPQAPPRWRKAVDGYFMEWRMLWRDIALGVFISALLMRLVPDSFWHSLFLVGAGDGIWVKIENSLVGPIVAVLSFVCSVGNIPIASALYSHGIGFGGTLSFIFADLITVPLLLVYRKYYGWKITLRMTAIFYAAMTLSGLAVDLLFSALDWAPVRGSGEMSHAMMDFFRWDYTTYLNILALVATLAAWLIRRRREPVSAHRH